MISPEQYLEQHGAGETVSEELRAHARLTCARANVLCELARVYPELRSGWRPAAYNASVPGAAPQSTHITGEGIDLADNSGALRAWAMRNLPELDRLGLWMEDPRATPSWLHIQTRAPKSGLRVFIPSADWARRLADAPKYA